MKLEFIQNSVFIATCSAFMVSMMMNLMIKWGIHNYIEAKLNLREFCFLCWSFWSNVIFCLTIFLDLGFMDNFHWVFLLCPFMATPLTLKLITIT